MVIFGSTIVLEILIGIGAVVGGANALAGGRGIPKEWLQDTPFKTYRVPGLVLLLLVGGSMLSSAGLLLDGSSVARLVSLEAGIILLAWAAAQLSMIGYRHWSQSLTAAFGIAVVTLSLLLPSPG